MAAIGLTDDNVAEVTIDLSDGSVRPLHDGTRATIRTVGLSGVTNRFIDLTPGPDSTPKIPDGGVIPATRTRGVVDLDAVLDAFDPALRHDVRGLIADAAVAFDERSAHQVNAGLEFLNPAVFQLTAVGRELTRDEPALEELVRRTSSLAGVLARHRESLGAGLVSTAGVLDALASRDDELAGALGDAPETVAAVTSLLRRLRTRTLPAVQPVVDRLGPVVTPLETLLRELPTTLHNAEPLVAGLRRLVPQARAELEPLPALRRSAVPAIASVTRALRDVLPIVTGLRPYAPDFVSGFFLGFGGSTGAAYDANGHFSRINLEGGPQSATGTPPLGAAGYRTGLDARCPGAAEEPAPDGSNPWLDAVGTACDPSDAKAP